jgi:hypothetical protein
MASIGAQDLGRASKVRDILLTKFAERSESHLVAAHIAKIRGDLADAARSYGEALRLDPRQTDAIFNLVDLSPAESISALAGTLEDLRRDPSLTERQSANVCFALARIHERAGNATLAFSLYQEGNAAAQSLLQSLGSGYDPVTMERQRDAIIGTFSATAVATPLEPLDLDLKMIFIVGLPRSGTTLVEQLLSSHSQVAAGGEVPFMQDCLMKLLGSRQAPEGGGLNRAPIVSDRSMLLQLRERYLDRLFERDLEAEYVTDKLPANFLAVGLIRLLFPDAIIVHSVRDPIATCWSLYSAHFGTHLSYYTSLEHLVHYHNAIYRPLMAHWKSVLGSHLIDVSYDDLVVSPETHIPDFLRRCGLPLEHANTSVPASPIYTASMLQARQPIYSTSISRWRPFKEYLGPLIAGLRTGTGGN